MYFALAQLGAALAPKDSGIARAGQAVGGMIQQRAYADAANNPNALMPSFLSPEQQTGLMNQRMAGRQDMRLDKQLELAQQQANNQNTQFTQTLQLQQQGQDADNQYRTLMQQGQQQQTNTLNQMRIEAQKADAARAQADSARWAAQQNMQKMQFELQDKLGNTEMAKARADLLGVVHAAVVPDLETGRPAMTPQAAYAMYGRLLEGAVDKQELLDSLTTYAAANAPQAVGTPPPAGAAASPPAAMPVFTNNVNTAPMPMGNAPVYDARSANISTTPLIPDMSGLWNWGQGQMDKIQQNYSNGQTMLDRPRAGIVPGTDQVAPPSWTPSAGAPVQTGPSTSVQAYPPIPANELDLRTGAIYTANGKNYQRTGLPLTHKDAFVEVQ